MNKLTSFLRLDFMTVKTYFTLKSMSVLVVLVVLLPTMSSSVVSGISMGMIFATLFAVYPFAIGEKSNMDALYATLSVSRETVVRGRYLFSLLTNAAMILFTVGIGAAGSLVLNRSGGTGGAVPAEAMLVLAAVFLLIQFMQLPVYFKVGYTKARFLIFIPFAAMSAGSVILASLNKDGGSPPAFLVNLLSGGAIIPVTAAALPIAALLSYRLSLAFYRKREF